jgi:hypothetical protein
VILGFAAILGATAAISRCNAAIAARVHLSSTSIAFSHSMTIVTAGSCPSPDLVERLAMRA